MDRSTKITLKEFVEAKKKELDDFYHRYLGDWHASSEVIFNSVDGQPDSAKVSVMGHASVTVKVSDLIDALKRVAANTTGIPDL